MIKLMINAENIALPAVFYWLNGISILQIKI